MSKKFNDDYPVLITIDPGKATGITISLLPDAKAPSLQGINATEVFSFEDMAALLWRIGVSYGRTGSVLVVESYVISGGTAAKTQAPWSLELIGAARMISIIWKFRFELQTPALAKSVASDHVLRTLDKRSQGWWTPTEGGHANDAIRHAATWLLRNNLLPVDVMKEMVPDDVR